jgi:hypothetical protein
MDQVRVDGEDGVHEWQLVDDGEADLVDGGERH